MAFERVRRMGRPLPAEMSAVPAARDLQRVLSLLPIRRASRRDVHDRLSHATRQALADTAHPQRQTLGPPHRNCSESPFSKLRRSRTVLERSQSGALSDSPQEIRCDSILPSAVARWQLLRPPNCKEAREAERGEMTATLKRSDKATTRDFQRKWLACRASRTALSACVRHYDS